MDRLLQEAKFFFCFRHIDRGRTLLLCSTKEKEKFCLEFEKNFQMRDGRLDVSRETLKNIDNWFSDKEQQRVLSIYSYGIGKNVKGKDFYWYLKYGGSDNGQIYSQVEWLYLTSKIVYNQLCLEYSTIYV